MMNIRSTTKQLDIRQSMLININEAWLVPQVHKIDVLSVKL